MFNQRAFCILLFACVLQACTGSAMHAANKSPGDASDGLTFQPGPDLVTTRDVAGNPDLFAAPEPRPDEAEVQDLFATSDPLSDANLPEASVDSGGDSTNIDLYCGDGIISGAEECDDGPANSDRNYGGCSTRCTINRCGDGILNGQEECDCGDYYSGDISIPPCAVRPVAWSLSYCFGCTLVPDIGP
jgi:cysteine-rich repeat protein